MKSDLVRSCKQAAKKHLDEEAGKIKRRMQQGEYDCLDSIYDDLVNLRDNYEGPRYAGVDTLIQDYMLAQLKRAADYFTRNQD